MSRRRCLAASAFLPFVSIGFLARLLELLALLFLKFEQAWLLNSYPFSWKYFQSRCICVSRNLRLNRASGCKSVNAIISVFKTSEHSATYQPLCAKNARERSIYGLSPTPTAYDAFVQQPDREATARPPQKTFQFRAKGLTYTGVEVLRLRRMRPSAPKAVLTRRTEPGSGTAFTETSSIK